MKTKYVLPFLIGIIAGAEFSCNKDRISFSPTPQNQKVGFRTDLDTLDYVDCPAILDSVYKSGDMLVFKNEEHFEKCALCLEMKYNTYNDQYDAQYPNATPEELDSLDLINNFDQWAPYLEFEDILGFSSLRARIEEEILQWLTSTPADSIDFESNPDFSTPVFLTSYRALFSDEGYAIVGSDTVSANDWGDRSLDDCTWLDWDTRVFDQVSDPELVNRKITVQIGIKSGLFVSCLWGQIKHFKKNNKGVYQLARGRISLYIFGLAYDDNCEDAGETWGGALNDFKNRSTMSESSYFWIKWREAFSNELHPDFYSIGCRTVGFWDNYNNQYEVFLSQFD